MKKITPKEISDELAKQSRPTLYTNQPIPLNDLSDRCFEILVYHIFKERLKVKDAEIVSIADTISLMQGVAEQGRDIILSKNGLNTGVVQCKKYKNNLTRPEVAQEILKFILYFIHDSSLIGSTSNFCYYFTVSTGFSGSAIGSFNDFGYYLINEIKLKEWTESIFKDYPKKFKGWKFENIELDLKEALTNISIKKIIPPDIEYLLSEFDHLNRHFFKVLTVTDNTLLEQIIGNYLKPILHKLDIHQIDTHDYTFRFKEYLKNSFEIYSSAKTLVFGNQQKKLEDIYYPLTVIKREEQRHISNKREPESHKIDKLHDDFIPIYKKIIIIDDGGMGKSTLLKWLFLSCIKLNKAIPLFLELRNINKENDILDEITDKLNPLNRTIEKSATAKILSEKGFIFFFDGYDEVKFENREFVTKNLQTFISKCPESFFIITSRPEKALLTFSDFQEFSVRKLYKNEAFELIKKLDNYKERSQRLIELIEKKQLNDVDEFLGNPLLVSLLYKKFEYRESISFQKQEFYYEVFEALFQAHDLSKGDSYIRDKESKLSLTEFFQILRGIGFHCIKEGIQFNEAQLIDLINKVKSSFSRDFDSYLFLNDLTKAVPLFQKDGLSIKWAHKSIQQYFAAEYICRDSKANQEKILLALYKSERIESYINILGLCYEIDYKSFRASILFDFCINFLNFYEKSFKKIKLAGEIEEKYIKERTGLIYLNKYFLYRVHDTKEDIHNLDILKTTPIKKAARKLKIKTDDIILFSQRTTDGFSIGTDFNLLFNYNIKGLLFRQKNEIISVKNYNNKDLSDFTLGVTEVNDDPMFFDNDDPKNFFNSPENFKKLNNLLIAGAIMIDYNSAKYVKESVIIEKQGLETDDITNGF